MKAKNRKRYLHPHKPKVSVQEAWDIVADHLMKTSNTSVMFVTDEYVERGVYRVGIGASSLTLDVLKSTKTYDHSFGLARFKDAVH